MFSIHVWLYLDEELRKEERGKQKEMTWQLVADSFRPSLDQV